MLPIGHGHGHGTANGQSYNNTAILISFECLKPRGDGTIKSGEEKVGSVS